MLHPKKTTVLATAEWQNISIILLHAWKDLSLLRKAPFLCTGSVLACSWCGCPGHFVQIQTSIMILTGWRFFLHSFLSLSLSVWETYIFKSQVEGCGPEFVAGLPCQSLLSWTVTPSIRLQSAVWKRLSEPFFLDPDSPEEIHEYCQQNVPETRQTLSLHCYTNSCFRILPACQSSLQKLSKKQRDNASEAI